ncbi:hypothetical protein [Faecalibacterium intestinale]|uniref:Uncharacterized protein n=1 Tax=Faecalibacterium intestinale TaxID=3133155 RepID=A0ABV1C7N0_9FIRM
MNENATIKKRRNTMLCSAQNPKLNKQFASGFAVASLFPFLRNELFPLRGKVFFCPFSGV